MSQSNNQGRWNVLHRYEEEGGSAPLSASIKEVHASEVSQSNLYTHQYHSIVFTIFDSIFLDAPKMSPIDSLSLAGKTAIVTGSGKENGIGAAIAIALARNGARVAINYVSEATAPRAATVAASIEALAGKDSVVVIQQDITTPEGTKKLVAEAIKAFGVDRIDILGKHHTHGTFAVNQCILLTSCSLIVNNAAWAAKEPVLTASQESIQKTFDACVLGPLYLIQATVPHMPQGGRIINVGSVASKLGIEAVYGAAKAAMDALTFSLARDVSAKVLFISTDKS